MFLPAILESKPTAITKKVQQVRGKCLRIHVDVIEPAFADNSTVYPVDWPEIVDIEIDVHLMVQEPKSWIDQSIQAGATSIIAQIEQLENVTSFIQQVKQTGKKVGLAIDLPTAVQQFNNETIEQFNFVDQILLLAVKAGFSGQKFDSVVLEKIKPMREYCRNSAEIIVDGGINLETAHVCLQAGADGVAINSWLWSDFPANLHRLQQLG